MAVAVAVAVAAAAAATAVVVAVVAAVALFPAQSLERGPDSARSGDGTATPTGVRPRVVSQAAPRAPRPLPRWRGPD